MDLDTIGIFDEKNPFSKARTPAWSAPEWPCAPSADIWGLGAIVTYLATGHAPSHEEELKDGETMRTFRLDQSRYVARVESILHNYSVDLERLMSSSLNFDPYCPSERAGILRNCGQSPEASNTV